MSIPKKVFFALVIVCVFMLGITISNIITSNCDTNNADKNQLTTCISAQGFINEEVVEREFTNVAYYHYDEKTRGFKSQDETLFLYLYSNDDISMYPLTAGNSYNVVFEYNYSGVNCKDDGSLDSFFVLGHIVEIK